MTSALLLAAVPIVVLCKSRRAAGVKFPEASARRGVDDGGAMLPFLPNKETFAVFKRLDEPSMSALTRKLFDALSASL
jgi:hypothetical protein